MTRSHSAARAPRVAALLAAVTTLLAGCGQLMGEDLSGLDATITNNTDRDLAISLQGGVYDQVDAGAVKKVEGLGAHDVCIIFGLSATTEDKMQVATLPPPVCDGDTWVIEPSDLKPAPSPSPSPSP